MIGANGFSKNGVCMAWSEVTSMHKEPRYSWEDRYGFRQMGRTGSWVWVGRRDGKPYLFVEDDGAEIFAAYEAWVMNGKNMEGEKANCVTIDIMYAVNEGEAANSVVSLNLVEGQLVQGLGWERVRALRVAKVHTDIWASGTEGPA